VVVPRLRACASSCANSARVVLATESMFAMLCSNAAAALTVPARATPITSAPIAKRLLCRCMPLAIAPVLRSTCSIAVRNCLFARVMAVRSVSAPPTALPMNGMVSILYAPGSVNHLGSPPGVLCCL